MNITEEDLSGICRSCGRREDLIFCNINHEEVQRLLKFIPGLIDTSDTSMPQDVCINCYQTIKTLNYNIGNIMDTQAIIKMQNNLKQKRADEFKEEKSMKRSIAEDIAAKYTSLKVRKIKIPTAEINSAKEKSPQKIDAEQIIVIEEMPDPSKTVPTKSEAHRSFMCISCSQKFSNFESLSEHLKSCKPTDNLKCFCGKSVANKKEFYNHVSICHPRNKRQHICTYCQKIFSSSMNLQNHVMQTHKPVKEVLKGIYMCHKCKSEFRTFNLLKTHREKLCTKVSES